MDFRIVGLVSSSPDAVPSFRVRDIIGTQRFDKADEVLDRTLEFHAIYYIRFILL